MRDLEQPVVQAHFRRVRMHRAQPMDVPFHLDRLRARSARFRVRIVLAAHGGDPAARVLVAAGALDDVTVAQAHLVAGEEAEVALRRVLREIFALDPQLARERQLAPAQLRLLRVVGRLAFLFLPPRVVLDDELHRIEHGDAAGRDFVQVLAHAVLENREVDPGIRLRHADALREEAKALGGEAAPARPDEGGHARVVPALDVFFLDELDQFPLGQHDVCEIEPRELDLPRQRPLQEAGPLHAVVSGPVLGEALVEPFVERAVVLELERAERVRDVLERVRNAVRPVVGGIDAPVVAGAVVRGVADAVHGRVAHVDVGRGHVDLRAQHVLAVGELALVHFAEELQVLLDAALAVGAVLAGLGERAAQRAHLLGGQAVHVGVAAAHQLFGELVQIFEVVRGVVLVRAPARVLPGKAEPLHRVADRIDVLRFLLRRVGVVEAQVAGAAILAREAEVEEDRLGVAVMQIAVGLGREARANLRRIGRRPVERERRAGLAVPLSLRVLARHEIGLDDLADEVRVRGFLLLPGRGCGHGAHGDSRDSTPALRRSPDDGISRFSPRCTRGRGRSPRPRRTPRAR